VHETLHIAAACVIEDSFCCISYANDRNVGRQGNLLARLLALRESDLRRRQKTHRATKNRPPEIHWSMLVRSLLPQRLTSQPITLEVRFSANQTLQRNVCAIPPTPPCKNAHTRAQTLQRQ
jgi:hypothetical protein